MKGSRLVFNSNKPGSNRLAPLSSNNNKKQAQSLIQRKVKARDLNSNMALQQHNNLIEKTPE